MAMLPILLDMVDELYESLDKKNKDHLDQIPLLFLPHRGELGGGCPKTSRNRCPRSVSLTKDCMSKECPGRICCKEEASKDAARQHVHESDCARGKCHRSASLTKECTSKECPGKDCCKETKEEASKDGATQHESGCARGKCHRSAGCRKSEMTPPKEWNTLAFYDHPWARQFPGEIMRRCQHYRAQAKGDEFQLALDVKAYKPEEITVKVKGREIMIEGKHEEREDEMGFVARHFTRRCHLPEEFDIETVSSYVNAAGKLVIRATKPKPAVNETGHRIIPVQREEAAEEEERKSESSDKQEPAFEIVNDVKH